MSDLDLPLAVRMMQDGYLMEIQDLKEKNEKLRELLRDYEELAAALCDARECDGCPFGSEQTICEHMRLIARVGELVVDA